MSDRINCRNCIHFNDLEYRCCLNDGSVIEKRCYFTLSNRKPKGKDVVIEHLKTRIADLEAKLGEMEKCAENNKKIALLVSAEHNAKIEKLEQQLAESEKPKEIRFNGFVIDCNYDDARNDLQKEILKMQEENNNLRKGQELQSYAQNVLEIKQLKQQIAEKDAEIEGRKNLCYLRYKQLQDAHKDKIEFAIDILKQIRNEIPLLAGMAQGKTFLVNYNQFKYHIDQRIKQLKESELTLLEEEDD